MMPRYFFNLAGAAHDPDDEDVELKDIAAAREEAVRAAAEHLRDRPDVVWGGEEFRMEVTDSDRLILFTFVALGVDAAAIGKTVS